MFTRSTRSLASGVSCLAVGLLLAIATSAGAAVLRVKHNAPGPSHTGESWADAYLTIQAALDAAQAGDEVWVAAGYYPQNLLLPAGVRLYGGFAGTETARAQRNPAVNRVSVYGDSIHRALLVQPGYPEEVLLPTAIDGLVIRNGSPGISSNQSNVTIANCTVEAGMYEGVEVWGANIVIENNVIRNNGSYGILCQACPDVVIRGNTITGSRAASIYLTVSPRAVVEGNTLADNDAVNGDTGTAGAIEIYGSDGLRIARNTIRGNRSEGGGGIGCRDSADVTVANNAITDNEGGAYDGGGGIRMEKSTGVIAGNLIAGNRSAYGGGIRADESTLSIRNNTIAGNGAIHGGGIYAWRGSALTLVNNILAWNNTGLILPDEYGTTAVLRSNCLFGNALYDVMGLPDPVGTDGNVGDDPRFARPGLDWHIQADSPCHDAGDTAALDEGETDIDGQPRLQGGTVDIGADESDGTAYPDTRKVLRVQPGGSDSSNGASWETAKRTIGGAFAAALPGDEVWVAAGSYDESVSLPTGVGLYGGFAGGEAERDPRDPSAHETVLKDVTAQDCLPFTALDGFTASGVSCTGASLTLSRNVIRNGSGLSLGAGSHATVRDNVIRGNTRVDGGGIYVYVSRPVITGNLITGNTATPSTLSVYAGRGGGIMCDSGRPVIANNVIVDNVARTGGGVYVYDTAWPVIANNTIAGNVAEMGGALAASAVPRDRALVVNNIIAHNSSGYHQLLADSTAVFRSNCFWDNRVYGVQNVPDPAGANGNFSADPKLARTASGAWHIQPDSPCVDAGEDVVETGTLADMDGQPRRQGETVDIGADESDGAIWPAPPVVRVGPDGQDAADGSSWEAAKATVGAALEAARAAGGGEVWVAAGIYRENVDVPPFTALYGGFRGDEAEREARDWAAHPTVLESGASGGSVVQFRQAGPFGALDGFTVRNGRAPEGAGILCRRASPRLEHNVITGNVAIESHAPPPSGGGIACIESAPVIANNLLHGNRATHATAILISSASPLVANNTIAYNAYANVPYGSVPAGAGSAVSIEPFSAPRIVNNVVAYNTAGFRFDTIITSTGNLVFANRVFDYTGKVGGIGDLKADPKFVDPGRGDYGPFHTSRAIDAGTDAVVRPGDRELAGRSRLSGAHVDMVAYEFVPGAGALDMTWVIRVLRVAGGLSASDEADMALLDAEGLGDPVRRLDTADAAALLRRAMGL